MAGGCAVLADVSEQQPIGPQFVRVAQFFWLLAGTVLHPGNGIVRQLPRLAGAGQFSQRCLQTELEKLLNAQDYRAAADVVAPRNRLVAPTGSRLQEKRRPQGAPFLLASRLADRLQFEQILFAELEGRTLPREGHDPLKHKLRYM